MNTEDSKFKRLEHEALLRASQPEQPIQSTHGPVAYACENAVGHKYFRWTKPSDVYKPIPLYIALPYHTLQERLEELHLYEEINQYYAKCNAGAENLRDWVAERMDTESVQLASRAELKEAFAQGMSCRPASVQRQPLTDAQIKNMDCRVEFEEHLRVVRMTEAVHGIGA